MGGWIRDGLMHYRDNVFSGLERAPEALAAMFRGDNFGKTLVTVGEDPTLTDTLAASRAAGDTLAGAE